MLDKVCWGIDVDGNNIYVSCHSARIVEGGGEVWILDLDGNMKKRIGVNNDVNNYLINHIISQHGQIYVSDYTSNTVTCIASDGHIEYQYSNTSLHFPAAIFVDDDGSIIVCG